MQRSDIIMQTWAARPKSAGAWDFRKQGTLKLPIPRETKKAMATEHPRYQLPKRIAFYLQPCHGSFVVGALDAVIVTVAEI